MLLQDDNIKVLVKFSFLFPSFHDFFCFFLFSSSFLYFSFHDDDNDDKNELKRDETTSYNTIYTKRKVK